MEDSKFRAELQVEKWGEILNLFEKFILDI